MASFDLLQTHNLSPIIQLPYTKTPARIVAIRLAAAAMTNARFWPSLIDAALHWNRLPHQTGGVPSRLLKVRADVLLSNN
jgi:hypothetical protein